MAQSKPLPPLITLEEHFLSESAMADPAVYQRYSEQSKHLPGLETKLRDLDKIRLQEMEAGQVSLQIISHAPTPLTAQQSIEANNQLAAAVRKHPHRFAGFAALPVAEPAAAADELLRAVRELHFIGALIDNHTADGRYYDGSEYDILWATASQLDVPIYLHPTWATPLVRKTLYTGNFTPGASGSMSTSGWGWHSDVAVHILRLFAAGVFDRFPKLKIIIGHFGEMIPFMLARINYLSKRWGERKRLFQQVWDENVWITTSGVWSVDPMACILMNTRVERILYSVDFPFARNEDGEKFMWDLRESGLVSQEQWEMIAYRNAEKLLGVRAPVRG